MALHDHDHVTTVPRGALIAAAVLIAFSIVLAGAARITGNNTVAAPEATPVVSRDLLFQDRADGGIRVVDAASGRIVKELPPGSNGFVRGMLRGLARDRLVHKVGPEPAFTLTRWSDGRHSITDTATGTVLHLAAFGFENVKEFATLLTAGQQAKAAINREENQ